MTIITREKTLYTLQDPTWLKKAGIDKGINHDRQHIDLILAAGDTLTVQQTNPKFTAPLTLWLLNTDSETEKSFSVTSKATDISFTTTSVPFITTPYTSSAELPVVKFSFSSTAKPLPVYNLNDNERAFFQLWDGHDAEFALIHSQYIQILVPKSDKAKMKNTGTADNLNGIINNYTQIFEFYNSLMGISVDATVATDKNIPNRYFAKADLNGPGGAYYGTNWTAESSSNIAGYWLAAMIDNWGALHEIGHGYEGKFVSDPQFSTHEVWNNIFAASFQNLVLGDLVYKKGWLYNYGKEAAVLATIQKNLKDNKSVASWDLRSKLFFMMQLKDRGGDNAFTHFYKNYRVISNQSGFVASDYLVLDLLSDSYLRIGGVDVTPYIYRAGATLSDKQREINLFNDGEPAYPLSELVSSTDAATLRTSLNLPSVLSLVTATELASTSLKGDLTIVLNIEDSTQISGESAFLLSEDASQPLLSIPISDDKLTLSQLPIGAYKLQLPTGKSKKYYVNGHYAIVKNGSNTQTATYETKLGALLANQSFNFLGLSDSLFCTLKIDHTRQTIRVDVNNTSPHSYFVNQAYAKIEIYDLAGNIVYNRTINGDKTTTSHDVIAFEPNYRINIFHAEVTNRLKLSPYIAGVVNTKSSNNSFIVTPAGLVNVAVENDPFVSLAASISKQAEIIRATPAMLAAKFASAKDDIYMAIALFPSPQKEQLLEDYKDVIPSNDSVVPEPVIQPNGFTLNLQGNAEGSEFTYEATVTANGCEAGASKTLIAADGKNPSLQVTVSDENGKALFKYVHQNP
ncbi:putative mucin/carbohydrate-binding domain-containing protein [Rahnella sp. PAMC 25559]|uniref:putative mucin/carbohydrate-binding domain-containing protein n=1 Tax=Rahnella sp. PAMC 25559 TaxID=3423225 RepID=UPI003D67E505